LATAICSIINQIFEEFNIPDTLKRGIITPVLKKKKDNTLPGNYRGIVVTNTFSKIIERLEKQLSPTQNPLQRGFTEHASSKFTAFIASETILIYKKINRDLELLTVDAEKAFDTVNHDIMLNKLRTQWLFISYVKSIVLHIDCPLLKLNYFSTNISIDIFTNFIIMFHKNYLLIHFYY
jgi:hypothetical protein